MTERLQHLEADENTRDQDAAFEDEHLAALQQAVDETEAELSRLRALHGTLSTEAATQTGRLESTQLRDRELIERQQHLGGEVEELSGEVGRLTERSTSWAHELDGLRSHKEQSAGLHQAQVAQLAALRPTHAEHGRALTGLRGEVQLKQNRLKVLLDLHRRLEGVGAGTKALLSFADPAVLGILADRIEVSAQYTDALAGLLGERLQCVIVSDPARGIELLDQLKREQLGRATIGLQGLAVASSTPAVPKDDPAVITRLIDEVLYEDADAALVQALIGNVVVTKDAQTALEVNARYPGSRVVSLDGTVVNGSGLVAGGSGDNVASAMVEQKREIRELQEQLTVLEAELEEHVTREVTLSAELRELEANVDHGRKSQHERELALLTAEKITRVVRPSWSARNGASKSSAPNSLGWLKARKARPPHSRKLVRDWPSWRSPKKNAPKRCSTPSGKPLKPRSNTRLKLPALPNARSAWPRCVNNSKRRVSAWCGSVVSKPLPTGVKPSSKPKNTNSRPNAASPRRNAHGPRRSQCNRCPTRRSPRSTRRSPSFARRGPHGFERPRSRAARIAQRVG